jgi:hypothetical protein
MYKMSQAGSLTAAISAVLVLSASSLAAHDVIYGGRSVSTPQQLNRHTQNDQASHIPGSAHEHVYQKPEYGKAPRQGHSVNGPNGSITIISAAPAGLYQAPAANRPGQLRGRRTTNITGPKLRYVPDYGKPPKDRQ